MWGSANGWLLGLRGHPPALKRHPCFVQEIRWRQFLLAVCALDAPLFRFPVECTSAFDLPARHLTRPGNSGFAYEIVRPAGEAPVADRGMERRCAVLDMYRPVGWTQRRDDLLAAAAR